MILIQAIPNAMVTDVAARNSKRRHSGLQYRTLRQVVHDEYPEQQSAA